MNIATAPETMFKRAPVSLILLVLTALAWLLATVLGLQPDFDIIAGFIPARLSGDAAAVGLVPVWLTPLTATMLHGGFWHLLSNMIVLAFIGPQIERVYGGAAVLVAYVVGAYVSALAQWGWDPAQAAPMIGASGAISALMGMFALTFGTPKRVSQDKRINRAVHALWLLVAWVLLQGMADVLASGQGVSIATPAHIGGFVAGLLLQRPLLMWRYRRA